MNALDELIVRNRFEAGLIDIVLCSEASAELARLRQDRVDLLEALKALLVPDASFRDFQRAADSAAKLVDRLEAE